MTGRIGLGVEVDGGLRAVVRAQRRRGRWVFSSAYAGAEAAERLAEAGASPRVVVAAGLPSEEAVLRRLTAPFGRVSKAARIFPALLETGLPFSLEQCHAVFLDLRRTGPRSVTGLGIAVPRERIGARLAALRAIGIHPSRLDHEGLALWSRSLAESPPAHAAEPRAVMVGTANRFSMAMGRGVVLEAAYGAAREPHQAPPGARRALQAWRAGFSEPIRGCWAGPATRNDSDREAMEHELSRTGLIRFEHHRDPESFLARSLAAAALEHPFDGGLLTGSLEPEWIRRAWSARIRRAGWAVLAAGLTLCLGALALRARLARAETASAAALNAFAREASGAAFIPYGFEEDRVRTVASEHAAAVAPFAPFFEPSLVRVTGQLVETARAQGLHIGRLHAHAGEIEIEGWAADWNHPDVLASRLRELGFSSELTREDADATERIPFVLRGTRP